MHYMLHCYGIQVIRHLSIVRATKIFYVWRFIFIHFCYLLSHVYLCISHSFWAKKLNRFLYSFLNKTPVNFGWIHLKTSLNSANSAPVLQTKGQLRFWLSVDPLVRVSKVLFLSSAAQQAFFSPSQISHLTRKTML